MCIIIDNRAGTKLAEHIVENSILMNPHGFAVFEIDSGTLTKTFDKEKAKELLSQQKPFIAHCRYKTQGEVNKENIHLFEMGDWLVAMNGTIGGLKDKNTNDTIQMIKMISEQVQQKKVVEFLNMWEARFLLYNRKTKKCIKTGDWINNDNVYFSKDNVLEEKKIYKQTYYPANFANHSQTQHVTTAQNSTDNSFNYEQTEEYIYYDIASSSWYYSEPENIERIFVDKITHEKLGFSIKDYVSNIDENIPVSTMMPYKYVCKNKKGKPKNVGISNMINFENECIEGILYPISGYNLNLLETKINNSKKFMINNLFVLTKDGTKAIQSNGIFAI